jgi:hypothetical protein
MKLTTNILLELGFRGEGKGITGRPTYRLKVPPNKKYGKHYYYQLQIELGDYPTTNPNCGILSLYDPEIKHMHCLSSQDITTELGTPKLGRKYGDVDFIDWIDKKNNICGGIKYITYSKRIVPIAHYIDTLEKLNAIYTALTFNSPLKLR